MTSARAVRTAAMALVVIGLLTAMTCHVTAQVDPTADLAIREVRVENAVYAASQPARVIVSIHNNGPGAGSGVLHFWYNSTQRRLTDDAASDQSFNTTNPIPPGGTVRFVLPWAPAQDQIGPGTVIVTLTAPADPVPRNDRNSTVTFVERFRFTHRSVDTPHETLPGRATPYRFNVTNTGNAPLRLHAEPSTPPSQGWTLSVPGSPIEIPRGASRSIALLMRPPAHAVDGDRSGAVVRLSVVENPLVGMLASVPETTATTQPARPILHGTTLQADPTTIALGPGGPLARGTLVVTNTGTAPDAFMLSAEPSGDLGGDLTVAITPALVALNASEQVSVKVSFGLVGSHAPEVAGQVRLVATSVNAAVFAPDAVDDDVVGIRVAAPDLLVTQIESPPSTYQLAGPVVVKVTVTNAGQLGANATQVRLTATRGGFEFARFQRPVAALAAGASDVASFSLPVASLVGQYTLQALADPDRTTAENDETNNELHRALAVRTAGLEVRPATPIEALPGQYVRYERPPHVFEVRNLGNAPETVTIRIQSEAGWVEQRMDVRLPAGARRAVPIAFMVPDAPGTEIDILQVSAVLANWTAIQASNTTTTVVVDQEAPVLRTLDFPGEQSAARPFTIAARWWDAVGVAGASVALETPAGITRAVDMTPGDDGIHRAELTLYELGVHRFRLEATDATRFANRFAEEVWHEFVISYTDRPSVSIAGIQGPILVRAGTAVPLHVQDDAGIVGVRVHGPEGEIDTPEPYAIRTDGWRQGVHAVSVSAVNRYGLASTLNVTIEVDNTPPEITGFEISPSRPRSGQPVVVRVVTDGTGFTATLNLQSDGLETVVVQLDPASDGTFQGSVAVPDGTYRGQVVVEDQAGNPASAEKTLTVGGDRWVPVLGPFWVLLLGSAVAVAQARRARRAR